MNFNPRLREGGDPFGWSNGNSSFYFNPRLREGGDDSEWCCNVNNRISIHASAKEATPMPNGAFPPETLFQSTPPRRRRHIGGKVPVGYRIISIHASAKEATTTNPSPSIYFIFQSTPPRMRRPHMRTTYIIIKIFQSTPPRRRRQLSQTAATEELENFNPRLREGGDEELPAGTYSVTIDFNPRLREGGDINPANHSFLRLKYFNPRLREGGDVSSAVKKLKSLIFQSTPPRRRRRKRSKWFKWNKRFQSTPPRRRRHYQNRTNQRA